MLKELFQKPINEPCIYERSIGDFEVELVDPTKRPVFDLQDNSRNLEIARENGVKPTSFSKIVEQLGKEKMSNMVLFDTAPYIGSAGNHWIISKLNESENTAVLMLCNTFGNYVYKEYLPMNIPMDEPLFTGVAIIDRERIEDISKLPQNRKGKFIIKDDIFWSNENQQMTHRENHPNPIISG